MASHTLKHAIGIFSNRRDAEQALGELKDMGFPMHHISLVSKSSDSHAELGNRDVQQPSVQQLSVQQQPSMTKTEGAKAGATLGSIGAGSLTLIVGLTSLLVPGVGQALVIESLIATFLGSGIAATAGGLYGALQGWFAPEEQASIYSDRFNQRAYLIIMEAIEDEILIAEPVLKRWGIRIWRVYDMRRCTIKNDSSKSRDLVMVEIVDEQPDRSD